MTDLPRGWEWSTLGELCQMNPRGFDLALNDDDQISFVPMPLVEAESGRIDGSRLATYGEIKHKSLTPFQDDDVLFAKITPCMENGKIALANGLHGGRALGSTELFVLRSDGAVEPRFLMHFLLQKSTRLDAERNMSGAVGQRRVPRKYLESLPVPMPPLAEQRRIVAALEDHLARLNRGGASLDHARKAIPALISSVRDAHVGGDNLNALPSGWRRGRLRDVLADIEAGKSFACETRPAREDEWGIIKVSAMTWGEFRDSENKAIPGGRSIDRRYEIQAGDILVSRANTPAYVGAPVLVRTLRPRLLLSDKSLRLRPLPEVDREWLIQVLSAPSTRRQITARATGTKDSMRNISQQSLLDIEIPIAPPGAQISIGSRIRALLDEADRSRNGLERLDRHAHSLRRALLAEAFAGRLVPQDSGDEPASELLGRIRVERAKAGPGRRTRKALPVQPVQEELS